MARRLPPLQTCPGCKVEHRSYRATCVFCTVAMLENAEAGAALARQQRQGRRQERLDALEGRAPVPYDEFPPGY
jgi:hypothetical protein